jgi:ABC-type Fe3+/spermidine/putrescine transport system ATPase subunit
MSVIYPFFSRCEKYTLDPFWKEYFINFSHNKFPQGMKYDPAKKSVILKDGSKNEIIPIPEGDSVATFQVVMKILKEKLKLQSTRELKVQRKEIEDSIKEQQSIQEVNNKDWKKIRPKNLKDQLIMDYIANLKEKYTLSLYEVKKVASTIQLGFQFKHISAEDIEYSDGVVQNITNLKYSKKTREFVLKSSSGSKMAAPVRRQCQSPVYSHIDKFLKENNMRIAKFSS